MDELEQMKQVLLFPQELEVKVLAWSYTNHGFLRHQFESIYAGGFPRWSKVGPEPGEPIAKPDESSIDDLHVLWPTMSSEVQRAFSIAYNENRLAGDPGIKTRDLIAPLLRIESPTLQQVVTDIPSQALPKATKGPVSDEAYVIEERP